jgi:hypothetical protein
VKPFRPDFTRREWTIVCSLRTPNAVQRWVNELSYNRESEGPSLRSFRQVVARRSAHCLEAALAAAVILEQHGYAPLLLDLESQDNLDHVLLLYQHDGLYGTVGKSRDPGLHGRRPVFRSLHALVDSYFDPFIDNTGRVQGYGVGNLQQLAGYDWRFSKRNLWKVQDYLIALPHRRFRSSERRYRYWLDRYRAFRARHPGRKPIYYPNRLSWTPGYPRGG